MGDTEDKRVKALREANKKVIADTSPEMQNFYNELLDLPGMSKIPIELTSGKRTLPVLEKKDDESKEEFAARKKKYEKENFSHHHSGNAIDLGAVNSEENVVFETLYNTKVGLELLDKYGFAVLDETNPDYLKKTGGTGEHLHIGKDSTQVKYTKQRLETFDEKTTTKITTFNNAANSGLGVFYKGETYTMDEYKALNVGHEGHDHGEQQTGRYTNYSDSYYIQGLDSQGAQHTVRSAEAIEKSLEEEDKKKAAKDAKKEKEYMLKLRAESEKKQALIEQIDQINSVVEQVKPKHQPGSNIGNVQYPDVQQQLPNMFKFE